MTLNVLVYTYFRYLKLCFGLNECRFILQSLKGGFKIETSWKKKTLHRAGNPFEQMNEQEQETVLFNQEIKSSWSPLGCVFLKFGETHKKPHLSNLVSCITFEEVNLGISRNRLPQRQPPLSEHLNKSFSQKWKQRCSRAKCINTTLWTYTQIHEATRSPAAFFIFIRRSLLDPRLGF